MTAEEAYIQYIQKAESNGSLDRLSTSRGAFMMLYNQVKDRVIMYVINKNFLEVEQYIQELLVSKREIPKEGELYKLPEDFLSEQTITLEIRNKEECKDRVFEATAFRIIPKELNFYLNNENYKPSFEWREFPYYLTEGNIKIELDNKTLINKVELTYYRQVPTIEMEDRLNPESRFRTQNLGVSDYMAERIVSACVGEFKFSAGHEDGMLFKQTQNENLI